MKYNQGCCPGLHQEKLKVKLDLKGLPGLGEKFLDWVSGGLISEDNVNLVDGYLCEEVPFPELCKSLTFFDDIGLKSLSCASRTYITMGIAFIMMLLIISLYWSSVMR